MEDELTPVLGPLLALLRSRKVMVALITLIVNALIVLVPELEPVQAELLVVLTALGTALIAAIAYEDGQRG
ncbi:MAG: hypothetical protein GYB64_13530 [Chloroflexi bacterium]|nr:hypothetical protein [Chloroflexota bacterium]